MSSPSGIMAACPNDNRVMESMEVTETMDTEIYDVREMLRRFYGNRKMAEMDEEINQKAEERAEQIAEQRAEQIAEQRAEQIAEQKVEEAVQKLEAKQKRKTKRECKKAFKAGEERTTISVVTRMFKQGFTLKSIMSACDLSEQDVIAIRDHGCLPK